MKKSWLLACVIVLLSLTVLLSIGCAKDETGSQAVHQLEITLTSENEWGYNRMVYPADYGIGAGIENRGRFRTHYITLYDPVWQNEMVLLIKITDVVDDAAYPRLCDALTIGDLREKFTMHIMRDLYRNDYRGYIVSRDSMAFRGKITPETVEQWLEIGESIMQQVNQQLNGRQVFKKVQ